MKKLKYKVRSVSRVKNYDVMSANNKQVSKEEFDKILIAAINTPSLFV